jgi:hypothetical protein
MREHQGWNYGAYSRFHIEPFVNRYGDTVYMVSDANWVTDAEVREGRRSPCVGQFSSIAEAHEWCDLVEEGKITSVPHEANFEGWPALKQRVQEGTK